MKFRTTKKEIKSNYNRIIRIGYCDAEYLLNYHSPIAYSAGVYGWACDYYDIDGILISTGYAPLDNKNTKSNYENTRKYNEAARTIIHGNSKTDDMRSQVDDLLHQFISEATGKQEG